ncbi:PREDICTED: glutathione S-transferase T3-like [Brassica oleracea var. oleracea]|uniref:Myb-like domain-containing protein n=1 Tax=Brassica oleracea var. oleracea TaxID=109376 RepID=A0A0D3AXR1_BRAOL|nr:PREDICTED: glutathione S-transferase T3-like [Brassica oleracea var. oleracea]
MDSYPSTGTSKFVDLLNSQQIVSFGNYEDSAELSSSQLPFLSSQVSEASNFDGDTGAERRERHKWTPKDDILLISSWLNTSKDPLVGNEQRSVAFWSRITAYFQTSSKDDGCEQREPNQLKHRWHRINDIVSKFCGAYDLLLGRKKKKFNLEHAWRELRHDQKWCDLATAKNEGTSKKRKCDDGADSSTSQATENKRSLCVKSAKTSGKKKVVDENYVNERLSKFQSMWTIKQGDLAMKERLSKMSLLYSLIGKKEPLAEYEEPLKKKLINDLIST